MARLTSPRGNSVEVRDDKVGELLRMGFSQEESKSTPKKASSRKSSSK